MTFFSRQAQSQTISPVTKRTAFVFVLAGLINIVGMSGSHAVSIGGCDNYVPLQGAVVECTPDITPPAPQGVIAPERDTTNNDISVTVQAGTFLDINGSTIGLGSGSIVVNNGRLNTQKFTNGYGISAGVNSRSQLGGSSITNNGEITTEGSNAHGIIISAERVTDGAGNTIINNGNIQTQGTGDGIRLFTTARGVSNQITNSGVIETAAKVAGIRLRSTQSEDTITNTGTINMQGANALGIVVLNTLNLPVVSNSGSITTTGSQGYAIYGDGALEFTNSGTLDADVYAIYFEDGTRSAGSNTVIFKDGSDITGGIKFNAQKTSETLVFDGFVDANFDNAIVNANNLSAIQAADVTMSAASYSFGVSEIAVDQTSQLIIAGSIVDGSVATAITKTGAGVLTLSNASTYTGGLEISAGTVAVGNSSSAGSGLIKINNGAVLQAAGASLSVANAIELTSGFGTIDASGFDLNVASAITGAGDLVKVGEGSLALSGQSAYSGSTTINAGILQANVADALPSNTTVTINAGTLALNDVNQTIGSLAGAGAVTLGTGTLTVGGNGSDTAYSGAISGTGGLTKDGTGTFTLLGENTYTGATTVDGGILKLGVANVVTQTALTVNTGATFDLNNFDQTVTGLVGAGSVTLGSGTLTVNSAANSDFAGAISGTGGLSKDGAGTFTLSGVNTYTGATSVLAGTLATEGDNRLADSLDVTIADGATFLLGGAQTAAAIRGDGTINLGEYRLTTGAQNSTFSGLITGGAGGITHDGPGTLILAGTTDFLGDLIINSGTVDLTTADSVRSDKIIELNAGGTLIVEQRTIIGILRQNGGILTGGGELVASLIETESGPLDAIIADDVEFKRGLVKVGDDLTTVGAPNTFTGIIKVQGGALQLATSSDEYPEGGSFAAASSVLMSGNSTLDLNGKDQTFSMVSGASGTIAMGSGSLTVSGTEDATYSGVITGSGDLIKDGTSVWTLAVENAYTGDTTVNGGTLKLGVANAVAQTALTVNTGGAFDLNNFDQTVTGLAGAGSVTLGSGTLTVNSAANSDFAGDISGTGNLVKDGAGTLALSGQSAYSGSTTINAGILQANVADALPSNTAVTINAGTLALNDVNQTIGSLAGAGAVTLGTGTLTVGGNDTDSSYSGIISGTGGLTKDGTGTFTLLAENTYTGATTVDGGILKLGLANALAQTALTVNTGATFDLNNFDQTVTGLAGAGSVTLGSGTLTVNSAANGEFAGDISGTGNLVKDGAGTLALSGQSAYTGSTTINAGILQANVADALPSNTAVTINAGTLALNNVNQTIGSLAGAGAVTLGTGTLTVGGDGSDTAYSGAISGAGGLVKTGAGVLTLSGANSYLGTSSVRSGTLALERNAALAAGSLSLSQGTVLQANADLLLPNEVELLGAARVDTQSQTISLSGAIVGAGGLTKVGLGDLTLSNANTYSGGTVLSQGVLVLANDNALGTGSLETAQDTTLRAGKANLTLANSVVVQGDTTIDTAGELVLLTGAVSGTGKLIKVGAGTLELAGVNSYSGGTQIEQGILALDVNGAASTGEVVMAAGTTIQADATLALDNLIKLRGEVEVNTQSFDVTFNNVVTNNSVGALVKTGSGMLTLNGVNTYTGGTTLVEGTLALFGRLASGVQIDSGTLLAGTGTINGDVVNRGIIQPRLNGSRSTLTIIGNYSGENAIFASKLGGTAPNAIVADQLAIVGAGAMASGSTTIAVSDPSGVLGQPTTGDGILLVGFSGGATGSETAFRSDRIAAGAYEYQVVRGGQSSAEDWYLRADNNTPVPPKPVTPQTAQREEVALYPILPSLARQYLMSITGTLDDRRGAPDSLPKERVAWARVIAQNNQTHPPNVNDGPDLKANDWGLQIGADVVRAEIDAGHWRMGPVITIGRSTGQAYNNSGSLNTGSVSLNGYSLGLNVTLAMDNGAYLDVLVQGTRLTGVSANSPLGTSIQTTGWGLSGSVEGGWRLGLSDTVSLTPQAQLYGVHTQLADSGDLYSRIEMPNASMLVGRVGLKISYDSKPIQGPKTQLWARVSALSTLSGRDASTSFLNVAGKNPTVFQSQAPATWMSLDAGVTVNAAPNTQINIGLGYQTSFNGQFTGISGQINARVGF